MRIILLSVPLLLGVLFASAGAAEEPVTELLPRDSETGIVKTTLPFHVPAENEIVWAVIQGSVQNPAAGYPAIIQVFDTNGVAVHLAQAEVDDDGSYRHVLRIRDARDGVPFNVLEGDYCVVIFKVVDHRGYGWV